MQNNTNPRPSGKGPGNSTNILGLAAFYHDSAACLIQDGRITAAAQEERFSRKKNDAEFPAAAVAYCLREGGVQAPDLECVAFYEKPFPKFDRLLHSYLAYAPAGLPSFLKSMPVWVKDKIWMKSNIAEALAFDGVIYFPEHHESHAASAFFPSPFREAAILTVDGVGEWTTTSYGIGRDNRIELESELHFPHSLGLLYSAFTYYTGFAVNSGEYKLMGLAPYGEPVYRDTILKELIDLREDGSFKLNMDYFNYGVGLTMTNERFHRLFGGPPRTPDTRITKHHMDLARSIQSVTEEVMCRAARHLQRQTGMKKLCMAGGVALNCVANGRILREGIFDEIWIQPAAGDAGGALGAALFAWHQILGKPRHADGVHDTQRASHLGPSYSRDEIRGFLKSSRIPFEELEDAELTERVAGLMADEKVVGWFQGRTEFGPRALGARSIIGDARSRRMQEVMNLKIKFRESFRPFAPCVLREHVHEWFQMRPNEDSPYMLLVAPVLDRHRNKLSESDQTMMRTDEDLLRRVKLPRSSVPAITHVDFSARVQTVDERHGRFRKLMEAFHRKTGCPIIVNTSFNLSWEPIVCSPQEAYHTFMQSEMDVLVLENALLLKRDQPLGFRAWSDSTTSLPAPDSPWADPATGDPLIVSRDAAVNPKTGKRYDVIDGIPRLSIPREDGAGPNRTSQAQSAAADYEEVDSVRAILENSRKQLFLRLLNEQIPFSASVVELGCGSGLLTNFLSIAHRTVLGVDSAMEALAPARRFAANNGNERAVFAQMDPLRPALREKFFDFVILNHRNFRGGTELAFQTAARLAKPGGFVVAVLTGSPTANALQALENCGLEPVNSIPLTRTGAPLSSRDRLFEPMQRASGWSQFWSRARSTAGGNPATGHAVISRRR